MSPAPAGRDRRLEDVVESVKSTNAGAAHLTFDLFCHTAEDLDRVCAALTPEAVARLYRLAPSQVRVIPVPALLGLKITIPRLTPFGSLDERDFDGVQQHVHLLAVPVPQAPAPGVPA